MLVRGSHDGSARQPKGKPYVGMDNADVKRIWETGKSYKLLLYQANRAKLASDHVSALRLSREADNLKDQIYRDFDIIL